MKINEKIQRLLEEKDWSLTFLHKEIVTSFEDNAITYLTLLRTIHGQTKLRESSIFQIASALSTTPQELRKDTDEEEKSIRFSYNKKAYLEIESNDLDFLTGRLVLMPEGKTETEQDPAEKGKFTKWLYGLQGQIVCLVQTGQGIQKLTIKKGASAHFNSTYPHHFENHTAKKAECLLIQNPKYI